MTTIQYINNDWFQDEFKMARHRLEGDMEIAYEDYKTQLLREGPFYLYLPLYSGRGNRWTKSTCYSVWDTENAFRPLVSVLK